MKKNLCTAFAACFFFCCASFSSMGQTVAYYVSTQGSDTNPGTIALPLATIAGVESKLAANYLNNCKAQSGPITVEFRGGTWYNQNIRLTNSGCSPAAPVVYKNFPGEVAAFSGGTLVSNWVNVSGSLWEATLPAATVNFESLFYNGQRRLRPRLGSPASGALGQYYRVLGTISGHYDRFYYNPADPISTTWANYAPAAGNPCGQAPGPSALQGEIEIIDFELWDVSRQRISCIDSVHNIIYLTGNTGSGFSHGYIKNHRYLVENINNLTVPGQWYVDRSVAGAWVLHYLANATENPNSATIVIPQQAQVFNSTNLKYRNFLGLTFSGDNYGVPSSGYAGSQAEAEISAAVQCVDCSNLTFDSDTFTNITGYALGLPTDNKGTSTSNLIQNNAFYDLGAGALIMGKVTTGGETDTNVPEFGTVQNNIVQGYGRMFPGAGGLVLLVGHDMTLTHNDVTDGYSLGIMICFPNTTRMCAGTTNSGGSFNVTTSYNHIWNLGHGILNDFGGIYYATYGATGGVITGNKIHDESDAGGIGDSDGYGANGIYIDRGGPITASNNLVYRVVNGVSITTGPTDPTQIVSVQNNILAYLRKDVIGMYQCPKAGYKQFSFTNNIIMQDRTSKSVPPATIQGGMSFVGLPVGVTQAYSGNDYWNTSEIFANDTKAFNSESSLCQKRLFYSLSGWQSFGEDGDSITQNPGFTNPTFPADDFSFLVGPPPIGFAPFPTSGTCATCAGRDNPVLIPPVVPEQFPTSPYAINAF